MAETGCGGGAEWAIIGALRVSFGLENVTRDNDLIYSGTRSSIPSCCHWWWSCCCCHCSGSFYVDNVVQSESSESPDPEPANTSAGKHTAHCLTLSEYLRYIFTITCPKSKSLKRETASLLWIVFKSHFLLC